MNLPLQFLDNMKNLLGADYDKYINSMQQPAVSGVRLNTIKADESVLSEFKITDRVPYCKNGYIIDSGKIGKHPYHMAGLVYVQEPSSMLAVCASGLDNEKDKNLAVLDLCAAPGGKSGQIAEILAGNGVLVSNEIEHKRAKILFSNIERMGYTNVIITNTTPENLANNLPTMFDYIFVDAPCGGEGMFRKDPDTINEWKQERLISNSERQKQILEYADEMLKPNGTLVYSTCTFAKEEDEDVVEYLLKKGYATVPLQEEVINNTAHFNNTDCRRFYPHISKGEGQFVCVLKKYNLQMEYSHAKRTYKMGNSELKLVNEFINNNFSLPFAVKYTKIGENISIINDNLQNMLNYMIKIPTISAGIDVGHIEKNRFIPHHNIFTAFGKFCKCKFNYELNDENVKKYLHGEQLIQNNNFTNGYGVICVNGYTLGGVKIVNDSLKNLYPKGLRI